MSLVQPSHDGSLRSGANLDIASFTLRVSDRSHCGAVRILTWFNGSPNPLGTLCVSDRSRCGTVLVFAGSLRSWEGNLTGSLEGPSMTTLQEFNGAVLEGSPYMTKVL